jgi:preprotein translocase subunit SecE
VGAGEAALPGGPPPPARRPTARGDEQPQQPERKHSFPGAQFVSECLGELKKVEWPNQKQVIQATVVVLVACIIVGTYLWLADLVFKPLVEKVFL